MSRKGNGGLSRRSYLRFAGTAAAGLLAASGNVSAETNQIGEVGSVTTEQPDEGTWHSVTLERTYDNPVVLMNPVSDDGYQPVHVRLRNVAGNGFDFSLEEWEYQGDGAHTAATAHYMVVEAGVHTLSDGTVVEVGTTKSNHTFGSVKFDASFSTAPVVFSQSQTFRGAQAIVTRNERISKKRFSVRVQEEEAFVNGHGGRHINETVGYVAVEPSVTSGFEAGFTEDAVTHERHRISFSESYDSPVFFADMQTTDGSDTANLRYGNLSTDGAEVYVQEESSYDDESRHTTERVGFLVGTPGKIFGNDGSSGGSDTTDDTSSDTTDDSTVAEYYTGQRLSSSDYGSLQAAIDDASARDIVVVDADHTLSSYLSLKPDIKVEDGGGRISVTGDAKAAFGLYESVENVWLDGLTIEGPGQKPVKTGTYGIGGPGGRGPFSNFRVTNCTVRDFPNNGISFVVEGSDDANDVYIGGNTIENCGSHGMVFGCGEVGGSNSNELTNLLVENNTVNGVDQAQGIGVFGHSGGVAHNCALVGNVVGRQTQDERGATFMSFEEEVHHCAAVGNEIHDVNRGTNLAVTKCAHDNLIANNYSHDGPSGANVNNYNYYIPEGPPVKNIYTGNYVENCRKGVHYKNIASPDNVFYDNQFANCNTDLSLAAPALGGSSDEPAVWGTTNDSTTTGVPDVIETERAYQTSDGRLGAKLSFSRGGPHPDEPVSVTVETYPDRY